MSDPIIADIYPAGGAAYNPAPTIAPRDREVLLARGIDPDGEVARARGYRTVTAAEARQLGFGGNARPGLLIPSHGTQRDVPRHQLRPHDPVIDPKTGKARKYLWPAGQGQTLDVSPATTALLRDVETPLLITEAPMKADALASFTEPGKYAITAVAGVYGWRSGDQPITDFEDFPARRKQDGYRRIAYLLFDSDAKTNPNVALARWRFSRYLDRRGYRVMFVDVPDAANGAKQGIDDALAAGADIEDLIASAYRAPRSMPEVPSAKTNGPITNLEEAELRIAQLESENQQLIGLITNPYLTHSEKVFLVQSGTMAIKAAQRGKVDEEGCITLTAGEVSRDFRPKPERGESKAKLNPDGSLYLMPRSTAKSAAKKLGNDLKLIPSKAGPVTITRKNGTEYTDNGIVLEPPISLAEYLRPAANYVPEEYQPRADYTKPVRCESCGEIHARTVKVTRETYCGTSDDPGCGALIGIKNTVVKIPVPASGRPDLTDEERERLEDQTRNPAAKTEERSMVTKNVTINNGPDPSPAPGSHTSVTKNVTMLENTDNRAKTESTPPIKQPDIPRCAHREFSAGEWRSCLNPTGGAFYCDDHTEVDRRAS